MGRQVTTSSQCPCLRLGKTNIFCPCNDSRNHDATAKEGFNVSHVCVGLLLQSCRIIRCPKEAIKRFSSFSLGILSPLRRCCFEHQFGMGLLMLHLTSRARQLQKQTLRDRRSWTPRHHHYRLHLVDLFRLVTGKVRTRSREKMQNGCLHVPFSKMILRMESRQSQCQHQDGLEKRLVVGPYGWAIGSLDGSIDGSETMERWCEVQYPVSQKMTYSIIYKWVHRQSAFPLQLCKLVVDSDLTYLVTVSCWLLRQYKKGPVVDRTLTIITYSLATVSCLLILRYNNCTHWRLRALK